MKFSGRITGAGGVPLASGVIEMVGPAGRIAQGKVVGGQFSFTAEPPAIWGLTIDGKAVAVLVASVHEQSVELGEIVLFAQGVPMELFNAQGGLAFGAPLSLLTGASGLRAFAAPASPATAAASAATAAAADAPLPTKRTVTFGNLVGGVALQLGKLPAENSGLALQDAKISVKGVPTTTDDAVALTFPTEELAATGIGLSEVSFTLKPKPPAAEQTTPTADGISVPNLSGYTRELAVRKLTKLGLLADTVSQVVKSDQDAGRVVRQSPAGGASTAAGSMVRLFIGKSGAL